MAPIIGESAFNFAEFWEKVRLHTAWDLEWYNGTAWISVKDDLTIIKNFPTEDKCKISLIFDASQAGNYRLTFAVDVRVREYIQKLEQYQYAVIFDDFDIIFDWSDIISIPNLQITHGVKDGYFWFRIRRDGVPQGAHLEIDPTVGTTTNTDPVIHPYHQKCFYANGRWWAWYYNGSYFGWETSVDGIDWTGAFTNYSSFAAPRHDVWYDETNNKICIVRAQGSTANIYYRQGTANGDGTISWDSAEVQITTENAWGPSVCKDSDGYPWVAWDNDNTPAIKVCKATTTSGSAWGSPVTLWTFSAPCDIAPLTSGKMLAVARKGSAGSYRFYSRLYTGSSWDAEVQATTTGGEYSSTFSLVADGDDAHLVWLTLTTFNIYYVKYTYGTGWGSEESVENTAWTTARAAITFRDTDKIRVFYLANSTTIKYRDRDLGSWQTAVTISSSESTLTNVSSSYKHISTKFAVMWKNGAASPYEVRIQTYTVEAPPPSAAGILAQVM